MKQRLQNAIAFVHDHWQIPVGAILLGILFFKLHYFAELAYAAIRFAAVILAASLALRFGPWRETVRKYIDLDAFVEEFHGQDVHHKVWQVFILIVALLVISAACFVHP